MKRLQIPKNKFLTLLFSIFLFPSSLYAEYTNLRCDIYFETGKQIHLLEINPKENTAEIFIENIQISGSSKSNSREIGVIAFDENVEGQQIFYAINRKNGNLIYKWSLNVFTELNPYYDPRRVKRIQEMKLANEITKDEYDVLVNGKISKGKCKKSKQKKNLF